MSLLEILLSAILVVLLFLAFAAFVLSRQLEGNHLLLSYISEPYQKHKFAISPYSDDD